VQQKYLKERLAGAFRLFHKLGYDETIAGHISVSLSAMLSVDTRCATPSTQSELSVREPHCG
jgi:ribulose-5-phosphate 4-epimerase/fuculose-1-phosphate aldolase